MAKLGKLLIEWPPEITSESEGDDLFFEDEWDYLINDYLTKLMRARKSYTGYWKASVEGFGWRNTSGQKVIKALTGLNLMGAILPDTDNSFRIYQYGSGFAVNNVHHDSPMWGKEWYYIKPIAQSTYEKNS